MACSTPGESEGGSPELLTRRAKATADRPDLGPQLGELTPGSCPPEPIWCDSDVGCLVRVERVVSRGSELDKPQSGIVEVHDWNVLTRYDIGNESALGETARSQGQCQNQGMSPGTDTRL